MGERTSNLASLLSLSTTDGSLASSIGDAAGELNASLTVDVTGLAANVSSSQLTDDVDVREAVLSTITATLSALLKSFQKTDAMVSVLLHIPD